MTKLSMRIARKKPAYQVKIVTDQVTGLPVLTAGPNAPILSSKEVEEMQEAAEDF